MILDRISGIIVAGGDGSSSVDFWAGDIGIKQLPNLPKEIAGPSIVSHNGTILLCGGLNNNIRKCLQLDNGTWKEHSINKARILHSMATTPTATFIFGGCHSKKTFEYLPKDSTKWMRGRTEIPGRGFDSGCAITVKSGQEIWLIGGWISQKRILSFNVKSHNFQVLPLQLNMGRQGHRCAFIPNTNKIMITGGYGVLDSTEVLDIESGSVTMGSPMNSRRSGHGIGVVTFNGEDRIAVFGGYDGGKELDSVELYNSHTEKWEMTQLKLSEPKFGFSSLTVKLGNILSNLQ